MQEKPFYSKAQEKDIRIIGGMLWKTPLRTQSSKPLFVRDNVLTITLSSQDSVENVENALQNERKNRGGISKYVRPLISFILTLVMLAIIGLIAIYGNTLYSFIMGTHGETIIGISQSKLLLAVFVILVGILYWLPSLFQGESKKISDWIFHLLEREERTTRRLYKAIHFLTSSGFPWRKQHHISEIVIWNPNFFGTKSWVWSCLIPAILRTKVKLTLYVKIDEQQLIENTLLSLSGTTLNWVEEELAEQEENERTIDLKYLSIFEQQLLSIFVFASTANLPDRWKNFSCEIADIKHAVSLPLARIIVERFGNRLFSNIEEESRNEINVATFARRCINDYRILKSCIHHWQDIWCINDDEVIQNTLPKMINMGYIVDYLLTSTEQVIADIEDPAAALVLLGIHSKLSLYNKEKIAAIENFVISVDQSEQYHLLRSYWNVIQNPLSTGNEEKIYTDNIYILLDIVVLQKLVILFERAGMYSEANQVYEHISMLYPIKAALGKARLLERQGKYDEAVYQLEQTENKWFKDAVKIEDEVKLIFFLILSWVIVSGRLEDKKQVGIEAIESAKSVLEKMGDTKRDAELLWHYYNNQAQYAEWEGNLPSGVENHAMCIKIPGVKQKWISGSMVNLGLNYRSIAKEIAANSPDTREQQAAYRKAIEYGERGILMKEEIGDEDELPIALHNAAHSYIEMASYVVVDKAEKNTYFQKALQYSQKGLDILERTSSSKKKGQLLTERFVSLFVPALEENLDNMPIEAINDLEKWLYEHVQEQSFDTNVVLEILLIPGIFNGNSLTGAIEWLRQTKESMSS